MYLVSGKKKLLPIIILALTSIQLGTPSYLLPLCSLAHTIRRDAGFSIGAIIMEYKLDLLFDRFRSSSLSTHRRTVLIRHAMQRNGNTESCVPRHETKNKGKKLI